MNWEAIAAIGQMLGSIAVFVTLGYLAVQIRHARGEVRRSINQSRSETVRQFYMTYATDERLENVRQKAHILLAGQPTGFARELMERTGMTAEEATAVFWDQMAWWSYRAQTIPYLDEGHPDLQHARLSRRAGAAPRRDGLDGGPGAPGHGRHRSPTRAHPAGLSDQGATRTAYAAPQPLKLVPRAIPVFTTTTGIKSQSARGWPR